MTEYGGLGGVWGGRPFDPEDLFEAAVARSLDLSDDAVAGEMWGALANQPWKHENGDIACYSFRAAGDLVAAVRAVPDEDYCTWYCSAPEIVTPRIAEALVHEGWRQMDERETKAYFNEPPSVYRKPGFVGKLVGIGTKILLKTAPFRP